MSTRSWRLLALAGAVTVFAAGIGLQVARDRLYPREAPELEPLLYVRSGATLKRLALAFDALLSDVYWIRAIQHYGGDRLAGHQERKYRLLYPLLDLTTSLDPYFTIAYRFGAIFLSEAYPGGPGRPDQAVALLRKGIGAQPGKWQYYLDIGFVHYWHLQDYTAAAHWFQKAADQPGAPNWLRPLAASMLTVGGDRASARFLWQQLLQSDQEWLRRTAERRLLQIDALEAAARLTALAQRFPPPAGQPHTWEDLVRRGVLRGVPLDVTGAPFELDAGTGEARVSPRSALQPMPDVATRRLPS
ncbi:MAG TPA: hypothetical protein VD833_05600 [Vicinamibacterales bacterium]|nr:hypothetical protein [Vicinamibacterales bacterium]